MVATMALIPCDESTEMGINCTSSNLISSMMAIYAKEKKEDLKQLLFVIHRLVFSRPFQPNQITHQVPEHLLELRVRMIGARSNVVSSKPETNTLVKVFENFVKTYSIQFHKVQ
jgi:hypothetical protein